MSKRFTPPPINQGHKRFSSSGKQVQVPESEVRSGDPERPVFCFRHTKKGFTVESCEDKKLLANLLERLEKLSRYTWLQINDFPKDGMGYETIRRDRLKETLPTFFTDDVKEVLVFRGRGIMRYVGHKSGPTLQLIFVDPHGKVYKH